jgi:hypothetical protein
LAGAVVTVETERIKGSNPWCLCWWWWLTLVSCYSRLRWIWSEVKTHQIFTIVYDLFFSRRQKASLWGSHTVNTRVTPPRLKKYLSILSTFKQVWGFFFEIAFKNHEKGVHFNSLWPTITTWLMREFMN